MRISHRHRFVFFANPKTGSESVRVLLDPLSDIRAVTFRQTTHDFPFYSHMRPVEARAAFARFGWPFDDYYRFVLVRNPWSRLASLYQMIQRHEPGVVQSFPAWLRGTSPDGAGGGGLDHQRWRRYGAYSLGAFAGDGGGGLLVDDVFRLEDVRDLPGCLRARGMPLPAAAGMPWVNQRGVQADLRAFYTPDLIDLVAERYAAEIAAYGYRFPK